MTSGFKPACLFTMVLLESGGFRRLPHQPFWRRLPEPTSCRTSFFLEDQVRTGTTTLTSAWPFEPTQICRRPRLLVNRKSGIGYQCRKSTVNCSQATQSPITGHDFSQHYRTTVATGCTFCRLQPAAYILTTKL